MNLRPAMVPTKLRCNGHFAQTVESRAIHHVCTLPFSTCSRRQCSAIGIHDDLHGGQAAHQPQAQPDAQKCASLFIQVVITKNATKKWTPKAKPWAHMRMLLAVQRFQKVRHPKDHIPACRCREHFLRHRWIGSIRGEHPQCEELLCSTVTHVSAAESNDNREFDVEKTVYIYITIYFVH